MPSDSKPVRTTSFSNIHEVCAIFETAVPGGTEVMTSLYDSEESARAAYDDDSFSVRYQTFPVWHVEVTDA